MEDGQETCQRCKRSGEDRRTLWMACFYAMHEIERVPFDHKEIEGNPNRFYTLRVCKSCRASWMQAIENWFTSQTMEDGD